MSSRDRKRAERQKRKSRSAARDRSSPTEREEIARGESVEDIAARAEAANPSRSELRNQQAREELEPLEPGERPRVVTIGAIISFLIAASIVIAWIAGVEVDVKGSNVDQRPNAFQVFPPALLFAVMGWGMLRARYWAVLGFEAIMAIIMVGSFITLIGATSLFKALSAGFVLAGCGALFWFTVKALARIQMPEPAERLGR
jgi:hypothetical protein